MLTTCTGGNSQRHNRAAPKAGTATTAPGKAADEGLRERKRRLTRHLIADAATAMFASRGFDTVKVSEIADRANVSMKTLYNYFPTKESMVLDDADELIAGLAAALRDRQAGTSITDAFVGALEANLSGFDLLDDELAAHVATTFAAMVKQTPALHAHWLEIQDRLARVAAEQLALQAGTEPTDPAPAVAGWALAGLVQVNMDSQRDGWVRIRVEAFGVNRSELKLRLGLGVGVSFPRVPGIEAAGTVDAAPARQRAGSRAEGRGDDGRHGAHL